MLSYQCALTLHQSSETYVFVNFFVALMDDQPVDCFHMSTMTASPILMR